MNVNRKIDEEKTVSFTFGCGWHIVFIRWMSFAATCKNGGCRASPDPLLVALAERADAAIVSAGDGVGREYANRLRSEHRPAWHAYFRGDGRRPGYPSQAQVVADFETLIEFIEAAVTWPKPGVYGIPKASKAPVIDGVLDDEVWGQAMTWRETYSFNQTNAAGPATVWRMLWDDNALYFAFDCADTDVIAPERERDGEVFNDDCVEMFILPDLLFRTYWELVIAPNGSVFDSLQSKDPQRWGCIADTTQNIPNLRHAHVIRGTLNNPDDLDSGYSTEVAIPFAALPGYTRCPPKPGDRLNFMLVRLDRSSGQFKAYSFRPLQGWAHNIWNHAVMELLPGK